MDDLYQAKLTAEPLTQSQANKPQAREHTLAKKNLSHPDDIHVQTHGSRGDQPIPIDLPNIHVHPYPAAPPGPREHTPPTPAAAPPAAPAPPITINVEQPASTSTDKSTDLQGSKTGLFTPTRPHPLLWLSLLLSLVALVLEVPKGSLPTLTGRHKALRAQERLVQEKLQLLTRLSTFLPPPLSSLVAPLNPHDPISTSLSALNNHQQLELLRLVPQLKFWNTAAVGVGWAGLYGHELSEDGQKWWSVEELGDGASVVRSKGEGQEREVWVLRMGEGQGQVDHAHAAVTSALTHSLLLRDRLQSEITHLRSTPCPSCPVESPASIPEGRVHSSQTSLRHGYPVDEDSDHEALRQEWERVEDQKRRERERERDVKEREIEVARREQWVVSEMRKLSDKVHDQANELTLEDRITERLKSYQRQLVNSREQTEL
ncbi:hypothetical protein IAR55_001595 [Kwoniella newhampshirensis]|uniref:Uncharacterized protein n=1 Tax=Kwoniella newhampshirensis TaxID=1651941 RepID=A0AAW0Z2H0_9TREE